MRPEQENPEQENINNVQLLLNRLSEVIQTPQVVRSCINAYNCLPREKILAIPSLSLALSKLDRSSGNDAVKYSTVFQMGPQRCFLSKEKLKLSEGRLGLTRYNDVGTFEQICILL